MQKLKCQNPWNPHCNNTDIVVFIRYKDETLPICQECWNKIADSDLEWGEETKNNILDSHPANNNNSSAITVERYCVLCKKPTLHVYRLQVKGFVCKFCGNVIKFDHGRDEAKAVVAENKGGEP